MKKMLAMILAAMMAMTAVICGAAAEDEWKDFTCAEEQFITRVPAAAVSRYETDNGLVVYTEHEGYIPNLTVHRRTGDMKFKNPTNYLNNVYREYLENKYGDDSRGMNPAKTWEVGGKQLLGARYMYMIGEYSVVQQVLIEVRDAGDVEYIVKYIDGQGDAILAATEEAVKNYRETDADAPAPEPEQQAAAGSVVAPVDMSNTQVDNQNGVYLARITDTDRIMDGGYFTVELYVGDIYALDAVWALQAGDKVQVNGKTYTVKSLQPEQDGRRELYVEEEIPGYIAFLNASNTACVAIVDDWTPCRKVGEEKIMLPLPNDFAFVWMNPDGDDGETYNADQFVALVTNADSAPVLNQYNTMVRFDNGLLTVISHQDYPYGPEETETAAPAETGMVDNSTPLFMIPSHFVERYNALMVALADQYAEQLGEEGVRIVKEDYTITQTDPVGEIIYYGNNAWSIEAGFMYGDAASASETAPALIMNYTIKAGVPDGAVFLTKYAIQMMIGYDFQDQVSLDDLTKWFDSAENPEDIFTLPGYTLNVYKTDEQLTYAVLPPAEQIPQIQNTQE